METQIKEKIGQWVELADQKLHTHERGEDVMRFAIEKSEDESFWELGEIAAENAILKVEDGRLLKHRFEMLGYEPTWLALYAILALCRTLGNCIMYMTYITWHASEKRMNKQLTIRDVVDILDGRMFSQKDLDELWDAQKVDIDTYHTDNLIDLLNPERLPKAG